MEETVPLLETGSILDEDKPIIHYDIPTAEAEELSPMIRKSFSRNVRNSQHRYFR